MTQPVIDLGSNLEENLERWSKALSGGGGKLTVFQVIYSGKRGRWTAKDISARIRRKLSPKRVTECGKKLLGDGLIRQVDGLYPIVYEKIPDVHHRKGSILRLAGNRRQREALPTKRRARVNVRISSDRRWAVREITVDDIDQFRGVRRFGVPRKLLKPLPEAKFKRALQKLFHDLGNHPDWGGEKGDFFTNNLRINGKRYSSAFALKGPGVGVKVVHPGDWGKRGNQIQRLVEAPARVFILQFEGQFNQDSIDQLRRLVEHKAQAQRARFFYGVIGREDSLRWRRAYPRQFN